MHVSQIYAYISDTVVLIDLSFCVTVSLLILQTCTQMGEVQTNEEEISTIKEKLLHTSAYFYQAHLYTNILAHCTTVSHFFLCLGWLMCKDTPSLLTLCSISHPSVIFRSCC